MHFCFDVFSWRDDFRRFVVSISFCLYALDSGRFSPWFESLSRLNRPGLLLCSKIILGEPVLICFQFDCLSSLCFFCWCFFCCFRPLLRQTGADILLSLEFVLRREVASRVDFLFSGCCCFWSFLDWLELAWLYKEWLPEVATSFFFDVNSCIVLWLFRLNGDNSIFWVACFYWKYISF